QPLVKFNPLSSGGAPTILKLNLSFPSNVAIPGSAPPPSRWRISTGPSTDQDPANSSPPFCCGIENFQLNLPSSLRLRSKFEPSARAAFHPPGSKPLSIGAG